MKRTKYLVVTIVVSTALALSAFAMSAGAQTDTTSSSKDTTLKLITAFEKVGESPLAQPQFDDGVQMAITTTRELPRRVQDLGARLDAGQLRSILLAWGKSPAHVYVCGATAFVESVATALVAEGIPSDRVRTERYGGLN